MRSYYEGLIKCIGLALLLLSFSETAEAQLETRWVKVGELSNHLNATGLWEPYHTAFEWPAIDHLSNNGYGNALRFGAENMVRRGGEPGPTLNRMDGRNWNDEIWRPVEFRQISKLPARDVTVYNPELAVEPLPSIENVEVIDEIDPDLPADRVIYAKSLTYAGITIERWYYVWSNEYHDDYHIVVSSFTNNTGNGNADGYEDGPIQEPVTYEGFYVGQQRQIRVALAAGAVVRPARWGAPMLYDVTGLDTDYHDVDFFSVFGWLGRAAGAADWDVLGTPVMADTDAQHTVKGDSVGRLVTGHMAGYLAIHGDVGAHDGTTPAFPRAGFSAVASDPDQPNGSGWQGGGVSLGALSGMQEGHIRPWSAAATDPLEDGEVTWKQHYAASQATRGGVRSWFSYGPYTLAPGETVTYVEAEGAGGLSREAKVEIGRAYKRIWERGEPVETPIAYDANGDGEITDLPGNGVEDGDEVQDKNMWVMTSRDSIFQTFNRAIENYRSGFQIPFAPAPPKSFTVTSSPGFVHLHWEKFSQAELGSDFPEPMEWEIWRTNGRDHYSLGHEKLATVPDSECSATECSYEDASAQRGLGYYYYLQAVGPVNTNGTAGTSTGVPLKSSRYYTQTYNSASALRPSGEALADVRVVPNPYSLRGATDLGGRWGDSQALRDRIGFLEIPGRCEIRIYTETGDLVRAIEHVNGTGDEYWNLTTESNQLISTGIYLALITDLDTGERTMRKFVVIR